jgi:hypothetical protein
VAVLFIKTYGRVLAPGLGALNSGLPEAVAASRHDDLDLERCYL